MSGGRGDHQDSTQPLRILFFARVEDGGEEQFLAAYEKIRHRVAAAPGHLADQLCQSSTDPREWLITSEWQTLAHYRAWAAQDGFGELSDPIVETTSRREHRPYLIRRTTPDRTGPATPDPVRRTIPEGSEHA